MNIIKEILNCLRGPSNEELTSSLLTSKASPTGFPSEKTPFYQDTRTAEDAAAAKVIWTLQNAEKNGDELARAVQEIVSAAGGWTERIAVAILARLADALKQGSLVMGQAMREAYEKASAAAEAIEGFARDGWRDHPVYCTVFCIVVALGILIILTPVIIHALGFGAMGPVEGSFAAAWQSTYGGFVEAGSLFSYLQKLGMLY
ncbi:MAG: hypothetical protein M1816_004944 [Peltula sp. TS41687]|nr:MAG: hypothetical protein M1816_004944 [Peltula sp. TS41687]